MERIKTLFASSCHHDKKLAFELLKQNLENDVTNAEAWKIAAEATIHDTQVQNIYRKLESYFKNVCPKVCSLDGCEKPFYAHFSRAETRIPLCRPHYDHMRRSSSHVSEKAKSVAETKEEVISEPKTVSESTKAVSEKTSKAVSETTSKAVSETSDNASKESASEICTTRNCKNKIYSRRMCNNCYQKWRRESIKSNSLKFESVSSKKQIVEKLVDVKRNPSKRSNAGDIHDPSRFLFKVRWQNFPNSKDDTWESPSHLPLKFQNQMKTLIANRK